jgi:hypothetical protein
MKPGDLVRVAGPRGAIFWRAATEYVGHEDFRVDPAGVMMIIEGPWTATWSKVDTGPRSETFVRVMHPQHGILNGHADCLEIVSSG